MVSASAAKCSLPRLLTPGITFGDNEKHKRHVIHSTGVILGKKWRCRSHPFHSVSTWASDTAARLFSSVFLWHTPKVGMCIPT